MSENDGSTWLAGVPEFKNLEKEYTKEVENGMVKIISIPDIESVNYGRGVGYEINEYTPPEDISKISATEIRKNLKK